MNSVVWATIALSVQKLATGWTIREPNPAVGMDICVVLCIGISDMRSEDIKVDNGSRRQNERRNPGGGEIFRTRPGRPWGPPSL
jgi:hypothetical protein